MDVNLPFTHDLAYRFDSLYQWLNRKYHLEQTEHPVGNRTFKIFRVNDHDKIIDDILKLSPHPDEHIPYWAELWPSAQALAQFILREQNLQKGLTIELGCGLALPALAARSKGAQVVLSDLEEDALRIAELNWIINFGESPVIQKLDWRNPQIEQKFEYILASDVAYERRLFLPLVETFEQLLAPGGEILLSEPNRVIAAGFFALLQREGFSWEKSVEVISNNDRQTRISIYKLTRL